MVSPVFFTLPFKPPTWIFFTSQKALSPFFEQYVFQPEVKFGAIGEATAEALKEYVPTIHFEGIGNDTGEIAERFSELLGPNDFVWLPGAQKSNRTLQKHLVPARYEEIAVYATKTVDRVVNQVYDLIVFTSPSNVEGFMMKNTLGSDQKVLAFGNTTAAKLLEYGITADTASGFTQVELFQSISRILS